MTFTGDPFNGWWIERWRRIKEFLERKGQETWKRVFVVLIGGIFLCGSFVPLSLAQGPLVSGQNDALKECQTLVLTKNQMRDATERIGVQNIMGLVAEIDRLKTELLAATKKAEIKPETEKKETK